MKQTYQTGLSGEKFAEEWLCREKGMQCLERRYRSKHGEIDLIMQDQDTIVFVEVKTRRTAAPGQGLLAVSTGKQKRIIQAATWYLMSRHELNSALRFDVIEIHGEDQVLYVANAFQGSGLFYR